MGLQHGKKSQKLSLSERVLLLTAILVLTVSVIVITPTKPLLTPQTQITTRIAQEANGQNGEGTSTWDKTYRGNREDGGRCGEQTVDGGYIIIGATKDGAGKTDVWLAKVSNPIDTTSESTTSTTSESTTSTTPESTTSTTPEGSVIVLGGSVGILLVTILLVIHPVRREKRKVR